MKRDRKGLYKLQRSPICVDQSKKIFFNLIIWYNFFVLLTSYLVVSDYCLKRIKSIIEIYKYRREPCCLLKCDPFLWQLNLINWLDNDIVRCDVAQYSIVARWDVVIILTLAGRCWARDGGATYLWCLQWSVGWASEERSTCQHGGHTVACLPSAQQPPRLSRRRRSHFV